MNNDNRNKKRWESREFNLSEQHRWKAKPGNRIFVINRGAVHFEYPREWVVKPEGDSICLYDGEEPDDDIRLQVSVMQLGPDGSIVNWDLLAPIEHLMENDLQRDVRHRTRRGPMLRVKRRDLEYAWLEIDFVDPTEKRKAHSRACIARGGNVQALITMEYWPEDHGIANDVWNGVLESLKLGVYVENPFRGPLKSQQ